MAKQAFYGSLIVSPISCFWYRFLHRKTIHLSKPATISLKVLADQIIFAPISLGVYFLYTSITDARIHLFPSIMKGEFKNTLYDNWKIWPIIQVINFSMIPLNFQSPFVNTFAIF